MEIVTPGSEAEGFCTASANIWQIIGYVLLIAKIVIPILVIAYGMLDLGKAVVAAKDDEIKKAMKMIALRAAAAIAIFFLPTIIGLLLSLVGSFSKEAEDWKVCRSCIVDPNGDCKNKATDAWNS